MAEFNVHTFLAELTSEHGVQDRDARPVVLIGFAKAGTEGSIEFAPETSCHRWVAIPEGLIDKIEHFGKRPCGDNLYDFVRLYLRFGDSAEAKALEQLLHTALSTGIMPFDISNTTLTTSNTWRCNAWYWLKDESFTRYYSFTVVANNYYQAATTADYTMRNWLNATWGDRWIRYSVNVSQARLREMAALDQGCECSAAESPGIPSQGHMGPQLGPVSSRGYAYIVAYGIPGPLPCFGFPNPNPGCSQVCNAPGVGYGTFCDYMVLCAGSNEYIYYNRFVPMT